MRNKEMAIEISKLLKEDDVNIPSKYVQYIIEMHGYFIKDLLLKEGKVRLYDLGNLYLRELPEKVYNTPVTKGPKKVPARKKVRFKPSATIKKIVKELT